VAFVPRQANFFARYPIERRRRRACAEVRPIARQHDIVIGSIKCARAVLSASIGVLVARIEQKLLRFGRALRSGNRDQLARWVESDGTGGDRIAEDIGPDPKLL
jgi:hypothetical protein